eukprot:gnl/MRDRNA2_/MRDRNA2_26446_c0_seq1.p2 gnl/MRDRNA2_/MRDRNA2_26446_c0~~gnl/MRDRNA2_/MRDRNA2_26446_c0_seq1.p2  ORF type:complete len:123 (-),score=17.84 gnl/MRDRNA2_/MRDRNA2_26446_c0_seq1:513-881(-)
MNGGLLVKDKIFLIRECFSASAGAARNIAWEGTAAVNRVLRAFVDAERYCLLKCLVANENAAGRITWELSAIRAMHVELVIIKVAFKLEGPPANARAIKHLAWKVATTILRMTQGHVPFEVL